MKNWQTDLVQALNWGWSFQSTFSALQKLASGMGFEYCAYGMRVPFPLTNPRYERINNYPEAWRARYDEQSYLDIDPTVRHARRSQTPRLWTDELFTPTPQLWTEAQDAGLRYGWFQSCTDARGIAGMLTLVRSHAPITEAELATEELKLRWMVQITHQSMAQMLTPRLGLQDESKLTDREIEVLQWTADGKTTGDISDILAISENTVKFHVKNAVFKLKTSNKTAAVVRAALLGLL